MVLLLPFIVMYLYKKFPGSKFQCLLEQNCVCSGYWFGIPLMPLVIVAWLNPYPTAFPYGNGMVLHLYQQQESSTTKTVHKVINKRLEMYV